FDLIEIPGFWQSPYIIENPAAPDSEFIFPLVYISNSPLGDSLSRVYVLRTNIGILNGNVQIIYKDIQNPEEIIQPGWLDSQITNENGDPIFTDWCEEDIIPYWSFALDPQYPGRIAFIGYAAYLDNPQNPPVEEGFFVYESLDYGETWTLYDFGMPPSIENFLQLEDDQGNVLDSIEVGIIGFNNTALYDGEGNLHWCYTGSYGYTDDEGSWNYFDHFIPACEFVWFGDDIVEWRNVWPPIPWEIDPETGDTLEYWSNAVSTTDSNLVFYENGQKQAVNLQNDWMIQTWSDGTILLYPFCDWLPVISICASKDNGRHWSTPIIIPNYWGRSHVYPYICDQIVDLGDGWGQVYMYYFDDNDYGSYIQGHGPNTGGQITYCSFKINFDSILVEIDEEQEQQIPEMLLFNYPNPMKNTTTISFLTTKNTPVLRSSATAKGEKDTKIRIYNVKGQLIKQFSILNSSRYISGSIVWDGKDENGRELPNGIYLYQLNYGNQSITKKMLILR
ncbi:MAG: T9SS type A sorting domain-containing protein, partial [Candidatus Cloacimonetes bacterium]|nr:T9SS type A sorting domain-containing protein [Candidatus Cloacimonadota bacterium]